MGAGGYRAFFVVAELDFGLRPAFDSTHNIICCVSWGKLMYLSEPSHRGGVVRIKEDERYNPSPCQVLGHCRK